jgi:hypothetical protein
MSSQSYNATTYAGYTASGSLDPFPSRDASDRTRMIKQRIIYNEKKSGSSINTGKSSLMVGGRPQVNPAGVNHLAAGNAEILWLPQGNQYRLSYLYGKVQCGSCVGNAFNLNGPQSGS